MRISDWSSDVCSSDPPGITWDGVVEDVTRNPAYDYDPSKPNNRSAQKFWPDGNPVMNVWVTLMTYVRYPLVQVDTGRRPLVLDSKKNQHGRTECKYRKRQNV